ncbi:hypothetical protein [Nocardioides ganghwensis]|jgi:hypothetical protein|uniref:Uncharacterized protein n=1 Tax=Nocardioides ganghwensis TaxID=252230 RepID=A0A4Q2SD84_9ACTN|nr:hypothetical protein [Nocardioides ganghwensis]MBD3947407.1 hypothetical protein [Nocardioides ganghwensis]RYC00344.1 hypothetical protein EUA07_14535 [Nocardioides ganghwensis]
MRFTDDEILAMAADAEAPVPVILTTVDTDDPDAVLAAALRGQRSLAVRGLVAPDRVDPVVAQLQRGMAAPARFSAFAGNDQLDRATALPATTWLPLAQGLVRLEEEAMGSFTVRDDTVDDARDEITAWFDAARDATPESDGGGPELWICLAAVTAAGVAGIAARTGALRATTVNTDGAASTESRDYAVAHDLVASLLRSAVRSRGTT